MRGGTINAILEGVLKPVNVLFALMELKCDVLITTLIILKCLIQTRTFHTIEEYSLIPKIKDLYSRDQPLIPTFVLQNLNWLDLSGNAKPAEHISRNT